VAPTSPHIQSAKWRTRALLFVWECRIKRREERKKERKKERKERMRERKERQ
jgi:hypothetical protein